MGCVGSRPQKEELLKYFWASLPIRRMTARRFKKSIKHYKRGDNQTEEAKNFKDHFVNSNYLVFGNEECQKVCRRIFEDEAEKKHFNHFLFAIALLCTWGAEPKDEADNKRWLRRIDEYLKLNIIRYTDGKEEWIDYNDLVIIYRRFVEMVSLRSVEHVMSLSETDEKVYVQELKLRYSESKIDALVRDRLLTRRQGATISEFCRVDLTWIITDDSCRQSLGIKEHHEKNYVSSTSTSHVVTKTSSEQTPVVTSSKQVTTYETNTTGSTSYVQTPVVTNSKVTTYETNNTGSTTYVQTPVVTNSKVTTYETNTTGSNSYVQPSVYTNKQVTVKQSGDDVSSSTTVTNQANYTNYEPYTKQVTYQKGSNDDVSSSTTSTYSTTNYQPSTTYSKQVTVKSSNDDVSSSTTNNTYSTSYQPSTTYSKQVTVKSSNDDVSSSTTNNTYSSTYQPSAYSKQVTYGSSTYGEQQPSVNSTSTKQVVYNTYGTQPTVTSSNKVTTYDSSSYESKPEVVKKSVVRRVIEPGTETRVESKTSGTNVVYDTNGGSTTTTTRVVYDQSNTGTTGGYTYGGGFGGVLKAVHDKHEGQ
jgi:hypothetical protein